MSRLARKPLNIPAGVDIKQQGNKLQVKGPKGTLEVGLHDEIAVNIADNELTVTAKKKKLPKSVKAMVGTTKVLLGNAVTGVTTGFERKLELLGVGYRAKAQGRSLEINLGYSHPIKYTAPEGITIETPSNTEVVVKGIRKDQVGQTSAEIRGFRAPEPYKGKGVRYTGELIAIKEVKKK